MARRLWPWWVLGGALSAGPLAGLVAGTWLPARSAVLVGVVAVVVGLVAPLAERARAEIAGRARLRGELPAWSAGGSERGRLPRVRDCRDPIALGVHPAAALAGGDRVPPFVRRDVDDELRQELGRPGLVLIVGESTAGKSRVGYEAMRAVLPGHRLVVPSGGDALAALAPVIVDLPRCVVWLDDLDRYLGAGGLSSELLTRLLGDGSRHVVVLATMRTQERARYDRLREAGLDDAGRQVWRRGRDVIERAHEVTLDRRWSAAELIRARDSRDPRIVSAVQGAGRFGLAEVLAAGPELVSTLRNAWSPGRNPRGAALVTAAVACRRAGVHRLVPGTVLEEIHQAYLTARGGTDLRPETWEEALLFATTAVYATTSLLLTDGHGGYLAHDYLVDAAPVGRIPDGTWRTLLGQVSAAEAYDVGVSAYDAFAFDHARTAFIRAADVGVPNATYMLAVTIGTAGRPAEAVGILQTLLASQQATVGPDHPDTLATRFNLALFTDEAGRAAAAVEAFGELLADRLRLFGPDDADTLVTRRRLATLTALAGLRDPAAAVTDLRQLLADSLRILGPDHPDTLRCRAMVAVWTSNAGDPLTGVSTLREIVADQSRVLGPDHLDTLRFRGYLACHTGVAGDPATAVAALRDLVADALRALGPDHPYTLECRHDLALFTGKAGDPSAAVAGLRDVLTDDLRVLGPDHPDTLETRHNLAEAIGKAGNRQAALAAFRDVLADRQRVLGPADPQTLETRTKLAEWAEPAN